MTAVDLSAHHLHEVTTTPEESTGLRPAALARYLDVTGLRHDYPLLLTEDEERPVVPLTVVVDELLREIAPVGAAGERLRQHVLRLETAIRRRLDRDPGPGALSVVWEDAATELLATARDPDALRESLETARAALDRDGRLVRCDDDAPAAVVRHLWDLDERARAAALAAEIGELVRRLRAMLAADEQRSAAGRDPSRLRAAVGTAHEADFDFDAWSTVLSSRPHDGPLPESRRSRVEWALDVLRHQRFVATGTDGEPHEPYPFTFDSCARALATHRERLPELARVVKATAIARLELDNAYDEAVHGPVFHTFDSAALEADDLVPFPRSLVLLDGGGVDRATRGQVLDVLVSPLPLSVVVVTSESVGPPQLHESVGLRPLTAIDLTAAALGLGRAPVVQTTSAGLARAAGAVRDALASDGPALVSVVTGTAGGGVGLSPYLAAAAATEARAVPTVAYAPDGGVDGRATVSLAHNPQVLDDWPVHTLAHEDEHLQRVREDVAFTVADLVVTDPRWADHLDVTPRRAWTDAMMPVAEYVAAAPSAREGRQPFITVVDQDDVLRRAVVDQRLVTAAERTLAAWRRLQDLARVRDVEVQPPTTEERSRGGDGAGGDTAAGDDGSRAAGTDAPAEPPALDDAVEDGSGADDDAAGPAAGEAWIETPRCTTCDECTTLNPRMFAYNEDKQAYIADLRAGTFGELVQAAETCQVAIIHPGEPWDPDEPGLDELRRRAAAFA